MEKAEIREIGKEELAQSVQIIREAFGTVAKAFGLTKKNCPTNGAFMEYGRLLSDYERGNKMFGCFCEGRQVGFVSISKINEEMYSIEKLAVLPERRKKGYGSAMVAHVKNYMKGINVHTVTIGIMDNHTILKEWYVKQGLSKKEKRHIRIYRLPYVLWSLTFNLKNV